MSNYATLKAAVQAVVKSNGNKEITGTNMQSTLLGMITSLASGYIFKGVATPSTSPGTPDENVFYIGGAGTYTNFGTSTTVPVGSIGVFKYNGSWSNSTVKLFTEAVASDFINPNDSMRAKIPTVGAIMDGYVSSVYDVSARNGGTTFPSLGALLSDANLATLIPTQYRQGGMEIRFVQTSDNKYVQFRLMTTSFSTTEADWQKDIGVVEKDDLTPELNDAVGAYGSNIDLHPKTEVSAYIRADNGATKNDSTQTLTIPSGSSGYLSDIGVSPYSLSAGKRNCMILHFKLLSGNWSELVLQRNVQFFKQIELSSSEHILYVYSDYAQDLTTMYCYFRRTSSSTLDHEVSIQAVHIYKWAYSLTDISSNQELYNETLIENISKGLQGNVDATFLTTQLNDLIGAYGANIDLHIKNERSPYLSAKNGASIDLTSQTLTIPSGSTGYTSDIGVSEETLVSGQRNCLMVHLKLLSGNWGDVFLFANSGFQRIINISDTERIYYLYRDYVSGSGERLYFYFRRTANSAIDHDFSMQVVHVYRWNYSLTDISSNQTIYIDNLKNAISDDVVFSVKKDGTADYTTLRAALEAAKKYTNVGKIVTINLSADTYELSDEYTTEELADTSFYGWPIGNNINVIGDENGTILSGNLTDAVASQSREGSGATNIGGFVATIDIVSTNCLLQNLEVRGYNVRYCVHDDRSAAGSIHKLKNCKFIRYNSTYGFKAACGAGCRANSKFVAEQCVFITEMPSATAFSMHDNVSFYKPASIVLKGCTFIGNGEYDVVVTSQGHGLSIRNTAWFENCTFNTFGLCVKESAYAVSPYYDWEVSGTNNNGFYQISQIAADTDVHIVYFFDEIKICTTSSTLHTGSPVILTSNNVCGMAHSIAWGKIAGIVLGVVDGKVYVKTKGDIHKSMLGISDNVPTGRFYKVSANDYVVTTEDDWYLLCKTPDILTIR